MRASSALLLAFSLLSVLACGGSFDQGDEDDDDDEQDDTGTDDSGDTGGGDSDTGGGDSDTGEADTGEADTDTGGETGDEPVTVGEVQQEGLLGIVTLEGVVATTGLSTNGTNFFVQDQGGGPWSGLRVYTTEFEASVSPGDVLTLTGDVQEFYDDTELVVLAPEDIVVTGRGTAIADTLRDPPADWETYEGVLVELLDVTLTSAPNEYGEATTDWDISLDDCLFSFGDAGFTGAGESFDRVVGVVLYSYEAYKVCPRDAGDFG